MGRHDYFQLGIQITTLAFLVAQAVALGQPGVAVSAVMGKAKLFGLLVDRKETRKGLLDDLPFDQLRILQEVLATLEHAEPTDEAT